MNSRRKLCRIGYRGFTPLYRLYVGPWIYTGTQVDILLALLQDGVPTSWFTDAIDIFKKLSPESEGYGEE